MIKALKRRWASVFLSLLILVLCNLPKSAMGNVAGFFFIGIDKLVHLGLFFCLAAVLIMEEVLWLESKHIKVGGLILILIFCFIYGAFIEYLQFKVFTYRSAELWDWICDAAGALMAVGFYVVLDFLLQNKGHK